MRFIKVMASVMVLFLAIGGVAFCGSISGQVVDKVTGKPVDAWLSLYKWNESNQWWEWESWKVAWSDTDDGNFSFSDLENGTYILYIESPFRGFFDIGSKKTYFPQWYDGVPGSNKDAATQIMLTDSDPDKTITVKLAPSPVSAGLSTDEDVPIEGGKIRYGVAVKNWTDQSFSLKAIIKVAGKDFNGWYFESPLSKVIQFNLPASETKSALLNLNVPAFAGDGYYLIKVEVGPSDKFPWFLYSESVMPFEKKGTKLSIVKNKEKLKEIYLKRIPKVLK